VEEPGRSNHFANADGSGIRIAKIAAVEIFEIPSECTARKQTYAFIVSLDKLKRGCNAALGEMTSILGWDKVRKFCVIRFIMQHTVTDIAEAKFLPTARDTIPFGLVVYEFCNRIRLSDARQ
jgi:hypothetical protein